MIILRTLFKPNKAKIFSSIMSQQNKKIIYNPMNTFFWKKEKKETEQMKKFKEINQEYKALKEIKQFMVKTDKTKSFISDAEKQKQEKAVLKAVKDYLDTYKFDDKFDELRFINLLSTVSYTYDNSKVLSDPRFADLIQEVAQDLRSFIDYRSITIFLNFCSYNDVNRPLIWENFNGVIRNKAEKFSFDEKLSILSSCNENNSAELEEFFEHFENLFLSELKDEKGAIDFQRVFRVLTLYRTFNKGSENFFYTLEDMIKANIDEMKMDDLTLFLMHYATNDLENQLTKHEIITRIEKRLSQTHIFLNNSQYLAVLFAFIKYGKGSDVFYELMERRALDLIDHFTIEQLKKLIILYANLPKHAKSVFVAIEKHAIDNLKRIPRGFISTLLQTFAELGYVSDRFYSHARNILLNNVYNMENEEFSKNLWAFSIQGDIQDTYFSKAAECIKSKLPEYTAKELSTFIWSFSQVNHKDQDLYNQIEEQIYAKLQTQSYTIKDIALLLWAYIQKVPLRPPTVDLMKSESEKLKDEAEAYDLAMILWGFSKFEGYPVEDFFKNLQDVCKELIPEMTNYELSVSLRAYAEANVGDEALYKAFVEKTMEVLEGLNYSEVISCVYSYSILSCVDKEMFKEVIEKLKERAKHLQNQIQVQAEEKKPKEKLEIDLQSVEAYLKNEAIEKLNQYR